MKRRAPPTALGKPPRERRALEQLRRATQRSTIVQNARLVSAEAAADLLAAVRAYLRAIGHDIPKLREPSARSLREMPEILRSNSPRRRPFG